MPGRDDPKIDTLHLVAEWFSDPSAGRWLIVLDNADDLNVVFGKPACETDSEPKRRLIDYLPKSKKGSLLVTTRDNRIGIRLRLASGDENPIVVGLMTISEGQELLQSHLGDLGDSKRGASSALVEALGRIPLAVTQAAAFIQQNSITLSEYLAMLEADDSETQALLEEDSGDLRRDSESQSSVFRTWKLSFDLIQKQRPRAVELLSLMSVLDYHRVPRMLFQDPGERTVETTTALGTLQAFCLVNSRGTPIDNAEDEPYTEYELHRLTQLATLKWLDVNNKIKDWHTHGLRRVEKAWPEVSHDFENWITCDLLLPHALKVLEYDLTEEEELPLKAALLTRLGAFDYSQGRHETARTRFLTSLDLCQLIGRQGDSLAQVNLGNMAMVHWVAGEYGKAEQIEVELVETEKRTMGADHLSTMNTMSNLAVTYLNLGRLEQAEQLEAQTLEVAKTKLGPHHPDTLPYMTNLGTIYDKQGRWDKAEQLHQEVLEIRRKALKADHPDTLLSMNNLAAVYSNQGRWEDAEKLHTQVIEGERKVLPADHPRLMNSLYNLASIYYKQGRLNEAEQLGLQAYETRKQALGLSHPHTLDVMNSLAITYWEQGRHNEAIDLMQRVVEIREKTVGIDHPTTLEAMKTLAIMQPNLPHKDL